MVPRVGKFGHGMNRIDSCSTPLRTRSQHCISNESKERDKDSICAALVLPPMLLKSEGRPVIATALVSQSREECIDLARSIVPRQQEGSTFPMQTNTIEVVRKTCSLSRF